MLNKTRTVPGKINKILYNGRCQQIEGSLERERRRPRLNPALWRTGDVRLEGNPEQLSTFLKSA